MRIIDGPNDTLVEGSDRRGQRIVSDCRLCQRTEQLKLSHILPRWAAQWMKEEGGVHGRVSALGVRVAEQDTAKHYLLCESCEQWLGQAEGYLSMLSRGSRDELAAVGVRVQPGPVVDGVNPQLLRRAIAGILLKGHFAPSPSWAAIRLDGPLIDGLRRRILADDFSELSHPLVATKWLSTRIPDANPRALSSPSWRVRPGYTGFDLMLGGWSWMLVLRGWKGMLRSQQFGLTEAYNVQNPGWRVMLGEVLDSRFFLDENNERPNWEIPPEQWRRRWEDCPSDRACPCGLSRKFKVCCEVTWCMK